MKIPKWLQPSLMLYMGVMVCDWLSSIAGWLSKAGVQESNPFSRNVGMNFSLHKGIVVDALFFIAYASIVWVIYRVVKEWREDWAHIIASALLIYVAADRLLTAVVPNVLLALHFYVADPSPASFILGRLVSR